MDRSHSSSASPSSVRRPLREGVGIDRRPSATNSLASLPHSGSQSALPLPGGAHGAAHAPHGAHGAAHVPSSVVHNNSGGPHDLHGASYGGSGGSNYGGSSQHLHSGSPHGSAAAAATAAAAAGMPFHRSPSAASVRTDISRPDTPLADDHLSHRHPSIASTSNGQPAAAQKIIFQTAPRRSSTSGKGSTPAKFVYKTSFGGVVEFQLSKEITTIGRKDDNDIVLTDNKTSKYHAEVTHTTDGYCISDKHSSNGVRVNDNLIEPGKLYLLVDNDNVMVGGISLLFHDIIHDHDTQAVPVSPQDEFLKLVTILPSGPKYEETLTIRAEIEAEEDVDFSHIEKVEDVEMLRQDYEKLRLAYELSKMSVTDDINKLLAKSMDLIFDILPIDRGVVLLVEQSTGFLSTHYVKLRSGKANERREILLSSTILQKVFYSRKCLITSDASEDPMLGKAASVKYGQIRSVICVPLIAHNVVHGILHLDSRDRINTFSSKDLSLVKAIGNQTAMVIENMNLIKEVGNKARMTEQLSRFLPPQVVEKMVTRPEIIRKGGRELVGTVSNPVEVVNLLNDYFERLVKVVFKFGGVVDKYIGDALMAVFGTLEDDRDAEYRAVCAAMEFQKAIRDMNEERRRADKEPVRVGVGVNTGELLAGFIGSSQRLEYTCIGDTVNTSSRVCDAAKADQVLITETTYEMVKDRIYCEQDGARQFKGKNKEVMVYQAIRAIV
ncbi:hypothetical protein BC831DRAFT_492691 [Entophlyctis helioformis]|nr:hypothetical protein BC831DRAFT_492691 [Entophlyctis helioformis]